MWITDHIDWTKAPRNRIEAPLSSTAQSEPALTSRCHNGQPVFDLTWMKKASKAGEELGIETSSGTYLFTRGPSYETPAEIRAFDFLGAHAVGMSTVPEAQEAVKLQMTVAGISTITNYAAGISSQQLDHTEVLEVGRQVRSNLEKLIRLLITFAPISST